MLHKWRIIYIFFALLSFVYLSGCTSIAEGVARAIIKDNDTEDTRACHIDGPPTEGLKAALLSQNRTENASSRTHEMKVLMVHGIGRHGPGYSGRLTEHLMRALSLNKRSEAIREVTLRDPEISDKPIGDLRISRYTRKGGEQHLIFFELSWSNVVEDEKHIIEFDDSTEYAFRRTEVNGYLKKFINSHVPDALIFLGEPKQKIFAAVRQSFCWMTQGDWEDYPLVADRQCDLTHPGRVGQLREDDYVFITHSLGSKIVIDTLQYYGSAFSRNNNRIALKIAEELQKKELKLYMLANQLPLLQVGLKKPQVRDQKNEYCRPGARHWRDRFLTKWQITAFSDPNDLLSYAIPPQFERHYLDSRLCAAITNVAVNVTKPKSLFGFTDFAMPGEAHGGYDKDVRVIEIISGGIGSADTSEIVKNQCTWLETEQY
jgi:hypothetical protein